MRKIASPVELQAELQRLLAYVGSGKPSRERIASELRGLAGKVAGLWTADQYVVISPKGRKLGIVEAKGPRDIDLVRALIQQGFLRGYALSSADLVDISYIGGASFEVLDGGEQTLLLTLEAENPV
jgi:hypothetical protein